MDKQGGLDRGNANALDINISMHWTRNHATGVLGRLAAIHPAQPLIEKKSIQINQRSFRSQRPDQDLFFCKEKKHGWGYHGNLL